MKKIAILITLLISGCGIAQQNTINAQYETQKKQSIKNRAGIKAIEYLIADDKMTVSEGGASLCDTGCTFDYLINSANKNSLAIVALYVGIHDYSGTAPSDYKIEDVIVRRKNGNQILNSFSMVFGSSQLADNNHVDLLYKDFVREKSYLGLNALSEREFKQQVKAIYDKRQEIVNKISEIRDSNLAYVNQIESERTKEYENTNPAMRVHVEDKIKNGNGYDLIIQALSNMEFYKRKSQREASLKELPITESAMLNYVSSAIQTCERVSAYSGYDLNSYCVRNVGNEMMEFAKMLNDSSTPQKTKLAAFSESRFGSYLDFGHAARLARMHNQLCKKQDNDGYVDMITVSVPCKDYKGAGIN